MRSRRLSISLGILLLSVSVSACRLQPQTSKLADYTTAIEQSPDLDEAYYNRGNTYHQLGEFEKSVADYGKAIEMRPDYAYAYANRSVSYEQMGKVEKVIADLKSALKIFQADGDTANEDKVMQEIKRVSVLKAYKEQTE